MVTHVHTETYSLMFTAVLFILAKRWKQPKCPSKMKGSTICYTYTYNGILPTITKNEVLTYAKTLINLKKHYTKAVKQKGLHIA